MSNYINKIMKKLTLGTAFLCSTIAFSYCKKEVDQQSRIANVIVSQANPAVIDFIAEPHSGNKSNLGQADIN